MILPITIAIPDSAVSDNSDIRSKTEKLFQLSRITAIFQAREILVYHDPYLKPAHAKRERRKITRILQYIECPQYLRKRLFPLSRDTAAVGVLSPLAIPHHIKSRDLKNNEIREAAIFLNQNQTVADVGGTELLTVIGWKKSLKEKTIRTTVQIVKADKRYKAKIYLKHPKDKYWGYSVHASDKILSKALQNRSEYKIATSRSCEPLNSIKEKINTNKGLLIAFGSPYHGIPQILKAEGKKVSEIFDICTNVLTKSGTRSLRLEEAMMITFSRLVDI
ncbi:MAG: putative RNA uridine N3 methyltransferase [Candidatus Hodarchaeales archaeon]|jgi:predicted SPOUT superfamily RNA methylase MTH1